MIIGYIDTIMLTYFRSFNEVGIYNTVLPTVLVLSYFGASISTVFFPIVSELWAKKDKTRIKWGINFLYKYSLLIVVPIALSLLSFPREILNVLFGPDYSDMGKLSMQILAIGVIFLTFNTINNSILSGLGKPNKVTKIILLAASFNILTNIILIPRFGMDGAALTTTLSYLIILLMSTGYVCKLIKLRKIFLLPWLKTITSGIVFVFIIYFLKIFFIFHFLIEAIICLLIAGTIYLVLTYLLRVWSFEEIMKTFKTAIKK
jgi:O-antigen/teichoic acid export membrane protein